MEQMLIDIFCDIDDFCNDSEEYWYIPCNGRQENNSKMQYVLDHYNCNTLSFVKSKNIQMVLQKSRL